MKTKRTPRRKRIAFTISVPPETARQYREIARRQSKNRSQLFREIFRLYREKLLEEEFRELQAYGAKQARARGVMTEAEVDKLVFSGR